MPAKVFLSKLSAFLPFFASLALFIFTNQGVFSQAASPFGENNPVATQDSLHKLAMRIIEPDNDAGRLENNTIFMEALRKAMLADTNLAQSFDSVRTVSFLRSPNGSFRIATWYVPLINGRFKYFGFVQTPATALNPAMLFKLTDMTPLLSQISGRELDKDQWYGAYYYELVHIKRRRKDYYTLLGWKGDNPQSRIRVIEPFRITEQGPIFGAQVFEAGDQKPFRIIFEYSARVSMSLKYHPDFPVRRRKTRQIIVFDRLTPTHESLMGNFKFYVPEVNVFDGFEFENGRWVFVNDVDGRVVIDPSKVPLNPVLPR